MNKNNEFEKRNYDDNTPIEPVNFKRSRRDDDMKINDGISSGGGGAPMPKRNFSDKKTPPKKQKKVQNRWGRAFVFSFAMVGLSVFLAFFAIASASDLFGLNQEDKQIEVVIKDKMSTSQIINELKKKKVIEQELTFRLYSMLPSSSAKFKPGTYILNSNMSYDEIIIALNVGDSVKEVVKITFYEGMTMREVAKLLEEKKVCGADDFMDYLDTATFDYDFVLKIPTDENRFRKYEGYLFPDTYEFYIGESVSRVANRFFSNFENKMTDELYAKMKNMNMTLDQTIALASMIQEEASAAEEMARVSSVFHNRLSAKEKYPNLESDVTIFYVEKDIKPYLDKNNQAMYDDYNTYKCVGLPVGPISNPGIDAINAALNPEATDYYFFVTDKRGKFYFSKTADEHYQNVRAAAKVDEQVAIEKAKEKAEQEKAEKEKADQSKSGISAAN